MPRPIGGGYQPDTKTPSARRADYDLIRRISGLDVRVTDLETRLEARLDDVETRLTDVETRLTELETRVTALENSGVTPSTAHIDFIEPNTGTGMVHTYINGSGFTPETVIEVVGHGPIATGHLSSNQVESNYLFPEPGVYQLGVRNPGEALSNTVPFTVT
jgi:hypothetical protein